MSELGKIEKLLETYVIKSTILLYDIQIYFLFLNVYPTAF